MRQILCVVDLSESAGNESAEKVFEVGARIANACKTQLIVLYPYRLINNGFQGDIRSLKRKLEADASDKFGELKKYLPQAPSSCEFVCEIGFVADRIEAHVKNDNVDMVIIGQQQSVATNDLKTLNLQQLIQDAKLPFVIVPAEVTVEAR